MTLTDAQTQAIQSIREHARYFGYDLSDVTDEEIIEGVTKAGKIIASSGVSIDEAGRAFRRIAQCGQGTECQS